eukprot:CAMPEP_0177253092 /NCGR_PEP_ID=MMETSP0367-20130122/54951_1 /TAXON_ID=447022 ORGANISM="Scrippsiella hangoei-like, Strain SHHI-4" /NCGR_SAMPLE_ID=MMETSP0367 /ASSEMBLY_ACC=CAM_ASM_000362 /LENGTH=45 /DNA_ID= /DNA_START= /DNA_END= /DNA_ORIENTATION=
MKEIIQVANSLGGALTDSHRVLRLMHAKSDLDPSHAFRQEVHNCG